MAQTIALIGFKGSGKSTVGRALAERLGVDYFDTDAMIEQEHEQKSGKMMYYRDIFIAHGAEYFEQMESGAIAKAFTQHTGQVVSLGGRALQNPAFNNLDKKSITFVHITVESDTLFERIMKDGPPPFFDDDDPRGSFERIYAQRAGGYAILADITVDNSGPSPEITVDDIIAQLDN